MIRFFAHGTPAPQGSKRGFYNHKIGRVQMVETNKDKVNTWRGDVILSARHQLPDTWVAYDAPVAIELVFYFARPKAHYRTGRNANLLRDGAPVLHTTKPDLDKLVRSTFDALTAAGVWRDDSLAADVHATKRYCNHEHPNPGALITIHAAVVPAPQEALL